MSREIIIADASCLIVLQNIQELSILRKLFGEVFITQEVEKEFGFDLPEWIKVKTVQNKTQQNALKLILDEGEASSIALSLETKDSLLIIDEKKGRRIAQELNLKIIGTLGIILRAKEKGLVNSIENVLEKLENAEFWISPNLKAKILENK
jgi:predicted nucleic acid-binding protein